MSKVAVYGAFTKVEEQDDGSLLVEGVASSETRDAAGELVRADGMRKALPDYLKWGAVREMHQPIAAGTAVSAEVRDDGKTYFVAKVVDAGSITKVKTGVLKGFSIGGKALKRDATDKTIIDELRLTEISLVDRPCNPDAAITLVKLDEGTPDMTDTTKAAPAAATTDPSAAPAPAAAPPSTAATEPGAAAPPTTPVAGDPVRKMDDGLMARIVAACQACIAACVECAKACVDGATSGSDCAYWCSDCVSACLYAARACIACCDACGGTMKADQADTLRKSLGAMRSLVEGIPGLKTDDLAKAQGALASADDALKKATAERDDLTKRATTAEDALTKMTTDRDAVTKALTDANGALEKVLGERDELTKQLGEAQAQLERKGVLRVVPISKVEDAGGAAAEEPTDAFGMIKKAHREGGVTALSPPPRR